MGWRSPQRGKLQHHIGKTFQAAMYPKTDVLGLGLLRLHSTFEHDLKIYSVMRDDVSMTAAAFAKSFLDLEGELLDSYISCETRTAHVELTSETHVRN